MQATAETVRQKGELVHRRLIAMVVVGIATLILGSCPGIAAVGAAPAKTTTVAPGSPGAESFFDLARKDCVGTARNQTSKIWFTIAHGVLCVLDHLA